MLLNMKAMPIAARMGFLVRKVALGKFYSEFFTFPLSISFYYCSIFNCASTGDWIMGPSVKYFHRNMVSRHTQAHTAKNSNNTEMQERLYILTLFCEKYLGIDTFYNKVNVVACMYLSRCSYDSMISGTI
jgi:hypothetical protein